MKVGKPKSKRVPVRLRHKIEKASNAKQRKERKEARKNPQWKSRVKKDPGIPNLFPYKGKLLAEVEENKRRKEEEVQRRREVARAQREGRAVREVDVEGDDVLLDEEEGSEVENGDMEVEDEGAGAGNPMAALLASASARADAYAEDEEDEDDDGGDSDVEKGEWDGIPDAPRSKTANSSETKSKPLPQQALSDPIKTCTKLLNQMQQTQDGIQRLLDHYQIPPLVTAGSDLPTRFLVEVARKRGRLGRGGVPNLHSAALTVLGDVHEGRVVLPAVETVAVEGKRVKGKKGGETKGEVTVVEKMAEPFRIEGLWGAENGGMDVES